MGGEALPISPHDLYSRLGAASASSPVEVPCDNSVKADDRLIASAIRRLSRAMMRTRATVTAILAGSAVLSGLATAAFCQTAGPDPLRLETKIPLGKVSGRIDHMAIDLQRGRLFVAELGNNSVAVVDIKSRRRVHVISGLKEPQGVGYVRPSDMLYVANAGDGSVRLFNGDDYADGGTIALGDDADNVRIDPTANRVIVGYGDGALAVIDPATRRKIADIPLGAHPESFQLTSDGERIYVNLPKSQSICVIDATAGKQIATWPTQGMNGNFAMALDAAASRVIVAFRNPAKLVAFSMIDSGIVNTIETCGDIDDIFVDAKRQRIYASCGEGFIDVFDKQSAPYRRIARIRTVPRARTSLFIPELDRLFVAVRASAGGPAAIWVFRPMP